MTKAYEVEVKYQLDSDSKKLLDEYLVKSGYQKLKQATETDTYYSRPDVDFIETKECLRIRKTDTFSELTYKPPTTDEMMKQCAIWKHEINIPLNNSEDAEHLLQYLECKELATVIKKRAVYQNNNVNISVDQVDNLGSFVEIEIMTTEDEVEQAKQTIQDIAQQIGLKEKDKPTMPYRDLLIAKTSAVMLND